MKGKEFQMGLLSLYNIMAVILNVVKDPALGLARILCEILHCVQNDTNIYYIAQLKTFRYFCSSK